MTEPHRGHGQPWGDGPPPWVGRGGFGPPSGRRFRRGALGALFLLVLLVAALATVVTSMASGNETHLWVTAPIAAALVSGLGAAARWLWRSTRTIGVLMDAADRVAGGDYATRVGHVQARQLVRLAGSFDQMTERLETNETRRRELLADLAHELRSPLQVIRGSVEAMLDGLYPTDESHLRLVLDKTKLMARLLDDLRTLSMAEAGVLALHRETLDPRVAAEDSASAFRTAADEAGVTIEVETTSDVPTSIDADPVRLTEILANLLTNAIRHTPRQGRVTVRVAGRAGGHGAAFEVDDTGAGIPADQLATVFDRFVTAADTGGTGLGLAIAKRLVEAHGGTIAAMSADSGGTRVRFEIPS
ncbi:MAG: HAMP domain-containing histidine kinase [Actinomycetota bacterium]|nr:HAMP domain-containing histidine kinase [Actinomycetota bacterium]